MDQARSFIVKDELKKDTNISLQALLRTLEEFRIPTDLIGKTVTINRIFKDNEGVYITFEENQKKQELRLPDLEEKWLERLRDNPKMKVALDELIMDSRSIGEGFLVYYGIEINKEFQIMQPICTSNLWKVVKNNEGRRGIVKIVTKLQPIHLIVVIMLCLYIIPEHAFAAGEVEAKVKEGLKQIQAFLTGIVVIVGICVGVW